MKRYPIRGFSASFATGRVPVRGAVLECRPISAGLPRPTVSMSARGRMDFWKESHRTIHRIVALIWHPFFRAP